MYVELLITILWNKDVVIREWLYVEWNFIVMLREHIEFNLQTKTTWNYEVTISYINYQNTHVNKKGETRYTVAEYKASEDKRVAWDVSGAE